MAATSCDDPRTLNKDPHRAPEQGARDPRLPPTPPAHASVGWALAHHRRERTSPRREGSLCEMPRTLCRHAPQHLVRPCAPSTFHPRASRDTLPGICPDPASISADAAHPLADPPRASRPTSPASAQILRTLSRDPASLSPDPCSISRDTSDHLARSWQPRARCLQPQARWSAASGEVLEGPREMPGAASERVCTVSREAIRVSRAPKFAPGGLTHAWDRP
jgi:hypothetical protein